MNWDLPDKGKASTFSVFEKTVSQLQDRDDAQWNGRRGRCIRREYSARAAMYDRNGPHFRAILALIRRRSLQPALDGERAAGRVRSPFHGVPIIFKDNIDVLGLPTTGGSRALVDHEPRLDSPRGGWDAKGGVVIIGKANLDEFPFGDFGISSVGGTIGNAYNPLLSTAGSSGGSATAVSTSLAALGFGTDTCNSLSNPSGFASLATIRATRGLVSRAGVMPLNPYNDAVGPMAKCVRDVAMAIDLVAGSDSEGCGHQGRGFPYSRVLCARPGQCFAQRPKDWRSAAAVRGSNRRA